MVAAYLIATLAFVFLITDNATGAHGYSIVTYAMMGFTIPLLAGGLLCQPFRETAKSTLRAAVVFLTSLALLHGYVAHLADFGTAIEANGAIAHIIAMMCGGASASLSAVANMRWRPTAV